MDDDRVDLSLPLSAEESKRLSELIAIIDQQFSSYARVGLALAEIQDNLLYRQTHTTFNAFCRARWSISGTHAYRLISAASVVSNLSPIGDIPTSENQVRSLVNLPPKIQQKVWKTARKASNSDQPAAKEVEALAKQERISLLRKKVDPKVIDALEADQITLRQAERIAEFDQAQQLEQLAVTAVIRSRSDALPSQRLRRCIEDLAQKIRPLIDQANDGDRENLLQGLAAELRNHFPEAILLLNQADSGSQPEPAPNPDSESES